jgi:hypothetical protein
MSMIPGWRWGAEHGADEYREVGRNDLVNSYLYSHRADELFKG